MGDAVSWTLKDAIIDFKYRGKRLCSYLDRVSNEPCAFVDGIRVSAHQVEGYMAQERGRRREELRHVHCIQGCTTN
ncbi:hypothetical protein SADUNF_Sadunf16G0010000 [Salix dunnii]|uniref:Uncharacterized protein n=1 Tax=Salix dunnii TaxID=1413687 RepID=A0A835MKK5_9ROSI|nr:hypothetical protein SADUNF_Sadunf16G0010000 [Salix dunnii]